MKKSYTTLVSGTFKLYTGQMYYAAAGSTIYLDSDYVATLHDGLVTLSTDWSKPVNALAIENGDGDQTYDFDMDGFDGEKLLKIEVTTADEDLPTGSTVVLKTQDATGVTTYETITLAVGAITAGNTTTLYAQPSSLLKALATRINLSGTVKQPAANTGTTTVTITIVDLDEQAFGAIYTIGAEAANVINLGIQLLAEDGTDLTQAGIVDFYISSDNRGLTPVATTDTVAIGTDGAIIGTVTDKQSYVIVSEADGDIDLNLTEADGATIYGVCVMPNGRKIVSPPIVFAS